MESWLTSFIHAIKEALKFQVATASGLEKPPTRMREIHSAGARKVKIPERKTSVHRPPTRGTRALYAGVNSVPKLIL